jgi:CubicO group peptidase (beta-lactamase class C family)
VRYASRHDAKTFEPLGMEDTDFWVPEGKRERLVTLYEKRDGLLVPYTANHFGPSEYFSRPAFISGGAGLTGTADDALRFGRMLLGEGELCGERVLSRYGVDWLRQNHLTPAQKDATTFDSLLGQGYGGLMRVLMEPGKSFTLGAVGEYGWDGWAGTYMTVCPAEDMVFVIFQQLTNAGTNELSRRMRNILYANLG